MMFLRLPPASTVLPERPAAEQSEDGDEQEQAERERSHTSPSS
jgi:hypothetical protein